MPDLGGLYCRMDDMCLGIECCITIEMLDMFQKTFRGYARFDPVDLALHVGFESWKYTFDFKELIPGMGSTFDKIKYCISSVIREFFFPSKTIPKI